MLSHINILHRILAFSIKRNHAFPNVRRIKTFIPYKFNTSLILWIVCIFPILRDVVFFYDTIHNCKDMICF